MNIQKFKYFISTNLKDEFTDEQYKKADKYASLLLEWNEQFNLTAITQPDEVLEKHFIDCLYPAKFIKFGSFNRVADIGTGAGFPGLVLAIFFPQTEFTLIESNTKKVTFLEHVVTELELQNVEILNMRAEDLHFQKEHFGLVTARAVTQMNILLELAMPLVEVGNYGVFYKGPSVFKELDLCKKAYKELGCTLDNVVDYTLPYSNSQRYITVIKKTGKCKAKYPRLYGEITKNPL